MDKMYTLTDMLEKLATYTKGYDIWFPHKVKLVSAEEGRCVCELKVDEDLVNSNNILHGSCTASIVDMVSTMALKTSSNRFPGVSIDLNVSYLAPAKPGDDLIIEAKALKTGESYAFITVDLKRKSDEVIVARGNHTKFVGHYSVMKNFLKRLKV